MKTTIIFLGIMLFSSSTFALADTKQVNEGHLRAHRDYEEQNLERQRFKDKGKLHNSKFKKSALKHTKKASRKTSSIQPEISLKTESAIIFGPYYRERTPRSNVSGLYQNQEWDVYPKFDEDISNAPPYSDFDHSSTKPPPPMLKTISKEKRSGDSP